MLFRPARKYRSTKTAKDIKSSAEEVSMEGEQLIPLPLNKPGARHGI